MLVNIVITHGFRVNVFTVGLSFFVAEIVTIKISLVFDKINKLLVLQFMRRVKTSVY